MTDEKKKKDEESRSDIHVSIGGNVDGEVNVAGRDINIRKTEMGDVSVTENVTINPFEEARKQLYQSEISEKAKKDAELAIDQLEQIDKQAEEDQPDADSLDRWLSFLEKVAPDVVEVLVNAIVNPGAAVSSGLRTVIKIWREGRKLA
jgi:hypothetical protein